MKTIAVCDDRPEAIRQISDYLELYVKQSGETFSTFYFSSGEELLLHLPEETDILFLDIQMPGMNGIDTARRLREQAKDLFIFFVSAYPSFAIEGYDVHAYAFLKKPVVYEDFRRNLSDAVTQLDKKKRRILKVSTGTTTQIIHVSRILYAEVMGHVTTLCLTKGRLEVQMSLKSLEDEVLQYGFYRCHKSYLVNMAKITAIQVSDLKMENGDLVPLSKHRRSAFLDAYAAYIGGRG